jgi:hypothetical protein
MEIIESMSVIRALLIEVKKGFDNVPKPEGLKELMSGVSLGKDKDGYFVYIHRCRSDSYESPHDIPKTRIKFVASTG